MAAKKTTEKPAKKPEMSRTSFRIAFDGPALERGTMDVQDLAPALLALGSLAERANVVLNGEKARSKVVVRARFRKGSFEINLEFVQDWISQALLAIGGGRIAGGANVLQYLGFLKNDGMSLLKTIVAIGGRKPKRILQLDHGGVRMEFDEGSVDAPREIALLIQDNDVQVQTRRMMRPLEREGVTTFKTLDDQHKTVMRVTKKDLLFFDPPKAPLEPTKHEELPLLAQHTRLAFKLGTLAFDGARWKLWLGDSQVTVDIEDAIFIEKVRTNQEQFAHDDVLICDVTIQQTESGSDIKTEHTITRVIEHRRSWKQMPLLGEPVR